MWFRRKTVTPPTTQVYLYKTVDGVRVDRGKPAQALADGWELMGTEPLSIGGTTMCNRYTFRKLNPNYTPPREHPTRPGWTEVEPGSGVYRESV